ncbi:MAG: cytochrome c3 family protein, partial [Syntrophales bacterium]|nr:cytochrome c3 family protein [Syntrophales bacterium]
MIASSISIPSRCASRFYRSRQRALCHRIKILLTILSICSFFIIISVSHTYAQTVRPSAGTWGNRTCQSCHAEDDLGKGFYRSVHGNNGCRSCHTGITNLDLHMSGQAKPAAVNCAGCHRDIAVRYKRDVHAVKENFACQDCHVQIHTLKKADENAKIAAAKNCTRCHSEGDYVLLGHGRAVMAGNQDAATCTDCHGLHNIPYYSLSQERDVAAAREAYTRRCKSCHADVKIAKRNNITTTAAQTYHETYHGKLMDIGFPQRVAGCPDCHTGHNNLRESDPRSTLHPDNLYNACKVCHKGIDKRFALYNPHPDPDNKKSQAVLYWTEMFMLCLLAGTFTFFWLHTALWWRRVYLDKCIERKSGFIYKETQPECRDEKQIQRFSIIERIMHVSLIISFFTLVMTGFPLKYHDTAWAKVMVNIWG